MSAEEVIRSLRERMPWAVAQKVLKRTGVNRSRGWDLTLQKVSEGEIDVGEREQELLDTLEEHLLCGEKLVKFFELTDAQATSLRATVGSLSPTSNIFSDAYPILIDAAEVTAGEHRLPVLTAVTEYPHGTAVVFGSIRYLTTREALDVAALPEEAADALTTFSEIIGVRHRKLEAIDLLWVPKDSNIIELRVDYPWGMLQRQAEAALDNLAAASTAALGTDYFGQQINLYPSIQSLYNATDDGSMVELGFMVSGSAQKLEKSRRGGQCCRVEAYHVGGKNALAAPILPYRVAVMWPTANGDGDAKAEVSLFGTSLMTADPEAFLGAMTVRNCADMDEYDHVRDRILDHLATT